ncbi:MAG: phosphomannose isomerase type II C-terminal cupin domain [Candidatus Nitrosocosmicus sp.]
MIESKMDIYIEDRPWGKFERYVENEKCTVKTLYIKPNSQTSLQCHDKRDEWWKVLKGSIIIVVNDNKYKLSENDSFFIKRGLKHQIINLEHPSMVLEISTGHFDEDDIVRLKDIYNRA